MRTGQQIATASRPPPTQEAYRKIPITPPPLLLRHGAFVALNSQDQALALAAVAATELEVPKGVMVVPRIITASTNRQPEVAVNVVPLAARPNLPKALRISLRRPRTTCHYILKAILPLLPLATTATRPSHHSGEGMTPVIPFAMHVVGSATVLVSRTVPVADFNPRLIL
jgi:hypothetical protein